MKRLLFITLAILPALSHSHAQWNQNGPRILHINDYLVVPHHPIDSKDGLVCAGDDSIWISTDTGLSWKYSGLNTSMRSGGFALTIALHDNKNGIVLAGGGYLYKTSNGGNSWNTIGPVQGAMTICYDGTIDDLIMSSSPNIGEIQISRNGGITWTKSNLPKSLPIYEIQSKNPGEAWATSGEQVFYTHDYGMTWELRASMPYLNFDHIALDSSSDSFLFAAGGENSGFFTNTNNMVAGIFSSCNGGYNWDTLLTRNVDFFCGSIATGKNTIFCQATVDSGGFYRSTNHGGTWTSIGGPGSRHDMKYFTLLNDNTIVASDSNGYMWRTTNSGGVPVSATSSLSSHVSGQYVTGNGLETDVEIDLPLSSLMGVTMDSLIVDMPLNPNVISVRSVSPSSGWLVASQLAVSGGVRIVLDRDVSIPIDTSGRLCIIQLNCPIPIPANAIVDLSQSILDTFVDVTQYFQPSTFSCTVSSSLHIPIINSCGYETLEQFMQTGHIPLGIRSITPNPASGVIQVSLINPTSSPISYQVFDALGMTRAEGQASGNTLTLDVHSLASGLYYLRASNAATGATASGRFVVVR